MTWMPETLKILHLGQDDVVWLVMVDMTKSEITSETTRTAGTISLISAQADCATFLDFAIPRGAEMRDHPAALVIQTRSWDFVEDIDQTYYCDTMNIVALDIGARVVDKRTNLPCDALDPVSYTHLTLPTILLV